MDELAARDRFVTARTAALATADAQGVPHLVPIVFAVHDDLIAFAVDHKPKRSTDLRRLRNIAANERVCLLVDRYDEDWSRLWWARADGRAAIVEDPAERATWIGRLAERYDAYRSRPPEGPVVVITVDRWSGWSAAS
ncbi:TIGR03668 family PPOX class F420-dependent oxidoreductase [Nonomuraea sp. NPDC059194]|uniref:TIGR03668 family PPOX class F420-dependent oxidoreductase n=1 Tax=Nonomuraea sp. NPDC059194 TaxID=3346764 RepID=UPI0036CB729E